MKAPLAKPILFGEDLQDVSIALSAIGEGAQYFWSGRQSMGLSVSIALSAIGEGAPRYNALPPMAKHVSIALSAIGEGAGEGSLVLASA